MTKAYKDVIPLGVSSLLMFASLFFGSKICAIGLLQYFLVVSWTMNKVLFNRFTIADFYNTVIKKSEESFKNKSYAMSGIYFVTIPMIIIGIVVIVLNIFVLFFLI